VCYREPSSQADGVLHPIVVTAPALKQGSTHPKAQAKKLREMCDDQGDH